MHAQRRVALLCIEPELESHDYTPFGFGIRRIQASLVADKELQAEVHVRESKSLDVDEWCEWVESTGADVVGCSAYVWSFPIFVEVARRLKRTHPERTVVFGGPSARRKMFELEPFAGAHAFVDAIVPGAGDFLLRDVVALPRRTHDDLLTVPGLAVAAHDGWRDSGRRVEVISLDELPSPTQMGLIPRGRTVAIERFRGCPLSCSFCQWGDSDIPEKVFSEEYLTRELAALLAQGAPSAQLVDAGINLNSRAFRNLRAAERAVGFFRSAKLFACVYPSHLSDEHFEFLESVRRPRLEVGLQSFSREVLDRLERPFREGHFAEIITALTRVAETEVEIILGLPGDNPEIFRSTLERARELPCLVRVFHCLVLPDALMTRGAPNFAMDFDPYTLRMRSCLGWSADDLLRERERLSELIVRDGGVMSDDTWQFHPRGDGEARCGGDHRVVASTHAAMLGEAVRLGSAGTWTLTEARSDGDGLLISLGTARGSLVLEALPVAQGRRCYRAVDGVAFSYRSDGKSATPDLGLLDEVIRRLSPSVRGLLPAATTVVHLPLAGHQ